MRKMIKQVLSYIIILVLVVPALIYAAPFLVGGSYSSVVMSSSMEPTIPLGSIVIIKKVNVEDIRVGDIIAFKVGESRVVHRVVEKVNEGENFYFTTKGDASEDPDQWIVKPEDVSGTLILTIPCYGYLIHFARTPTGFVLMVITPAILLIANEVRKILQLKKAGKVEQKNPGTSVVD